MTTKDEVREEFMSFFKKEYLADKKTHELCADWWLSKFDTILAKKREEAKNSLTLIDHNGTTMIPLDDIIKILT